RPTPRPTLFPYTTLFRSCGYHCCRCCLPPPCSLCSIPWCPIAMCHFAKGFWVELLPLCCLKLPKRASPNLLSSPPPTKLFTVLLLRCRCFCYGCMCLGS